MFGFGRASPVKTLAPDEVRDLVQAGAITLVDVREDGEWASGRLAGAIHRPLSRLKQSAPDIPADRPVVFYCLSVARSARAVAICRVLGLKHDTHMAGGATAWRAHGYPLTR